MALREYKWRKENTEKRKQTYKKLNSVQTDIRLDFLFQILYFFAFKIPPHTVEYNINTLKA